MSIKLLFLCVTVSCSLACFADDEDGVRIVSQTEDTVYVGISGVVNGVAHLNEWLHFHQRKAVTSFAPIYSSNGVIGYVMAFKDGNGKDQAFESVPIVYGDRGCLITIDKWRKAHPERKLEAFTTIVIDRRVSSMIFCYSTTTELEKSVTTPNKN